MYSPVFVLGPTTSGSPPVRSISWSDHSFSGLASSFACILAQSRPVWRFMFFSKRVFKVPSSSSRCSGDNFFLVSGGIFLAPAFVQHRQGTDRSQLFQARLYPLRRCLGQRVG